MTWLLVCKILNIEGSSLLVLKVDDVSRSIVDISRNLQAWDPFKVFHIHNKAGSVSINQLTQIIGNILGSPIQVLPYDQWIERLRKTCSEQQQVCLWF